MISFGWKRKLAPRFLTPFEILECISKVIYELVLPVSVSLLCKHISDPTHMLGVNNIKLKDNLVYEEHPIQILDRRLK